MLRAGRAWRTGSGSGDRTARVSPSARTASSRAAAGTRQDSLCPGPEPRRNPHPGHRGGPLRRTKRPGLQILLEAAEPFFIHGSPPRSRRRCFRARKRWTRTVGRQQAEDARRLPVGPALDFCEIDDRPLPWGQAGEGTGRRPGAPRLSTGAPPAFRSAPRAEDCDAPSAGSGGPRCAASRRGSSQAGGASPGAARRGRRHPAPDPRPRRLRRGWSAPAPPSRARAAQRDGRRPRRSPARARRTGSSGVSIGSAEVCQPAWVVAFTSGRGQEWAGTFTRNVERRHWSVVLSPNCTLRARHKITSSLDSVQRRHRGTLMGE